MSPMIVEAARAFKVDGAKLVSVDGAGVLGRIVGRLDEEEEGDEGVSEAEEDDSDRAPAGLSLWVTCGSTVGSASIAPSTSSALPLLLSVESMPESIFRSVNASAALFWHAYEAETYVCSRETNSASCCSGVVVVV